MREWENVNEAQIAAAMLFLNVSEQHSAAPVVGEENISFLSLCFPKKFILLLSYPVIPSSIILLLLLLPSFPAVFFFVGWQAVALSLFLTHFNGYLPNHIFIAGNFRTPHCVSWRSAPFLARHRWLLGCVEPASVCACVWVSGVKKKEGVGGGRWRGVALVSVCCQDPLPLLPLLLLFVTIVKSWQKMVGAIAKKTLSSARQKKTIMLFLSHDRVA